MAVCLTAENLSWGTPEGRVLGQGLSFELRSGQLLWIQGPNGSGKSTLVQTLLRDRKPLAGKIDAFLTLDQIGYVPQVQNRECHLPLSLRDVVGLAHRQVTDPAHWGLLDASRWDLSWNRASGCERQRTLLIRELVSAPKLLFLDEPLNHLDECSKQQMQSALRRLLTEPGAPALVIVSHGGLGLASELPRGGLRVELHGDGSLSTEILQRLDSKETVA
jgi:iron complex transport system ATP-binding protein